MASETEVTLRLGVVRAKGPQPRRFVSSSDLCRARGINHRWSLSSAVEVSFCVRCSRVSKLLLFTARVLMFGILHSSARSGLWRKIQFRRIRCFHLRSGRFCGRPTANTPRHVEFKGCCTKSASVTRYSSGGRRDALSRQTREWRRARALLENNRFVPPPAVAAHLRAPLDYDLFHCSPMQQQAGK